MMPYKFHDMSWTRDEFIASMDPSLLQPDEINKAFASEAIYWCKPLPHNKLREILGNSLCMGLYDTSTPHAAGPASGSVLQNMSASNGDSLTTQQPVGRQVGFARLITDYATFAWGTDYYVLPEYQNIGLGVWLQECLCELLDAIEDSMDRSLRSFRVMSAGVERTVQWYARNMGFRKLEHGQGGLVFLVRRCGG